MNNLILIYGQDSYRMREKLREMVSNLKAQHKGLLIKELDLNIGTPRELSAMFSQNSLFGQKKLFIIRNAFANDKLFEYFDSLTVRPDHFLRISVIIYEEGEPQNTDKLFKFLQKYGNIHRYSLLEGRPLIKWIEKETQKLGGIIEKPAASYLAGCFGSNTWALSSQIKKFIAFKKGKTITLKDIKDFVRQEASAVIFQALDALSDGKRAKALQHLAVHLARGESPFYLLGMLSYQIRNMLLAKKITEGRLSFKESGLHPYVFKKLALSARRFSEQDLKKALRKIFEMDRDIKTGKVEPDLALELLIVELMGSN